MNFVFYFTSLKGLFPTQSNQTSSAACPTMPAPAEGSSKTASLRSPLLITRREIWHTTAKEHPWNFRIKTSDVNRIIQLRSGLFEGLGSTHHICIGSLSVLLTLPARDNL